LKEIKNDGQSVKHLKWEWRTLKLFVIYN
jgi:hypothetical protein